MKPGYQTTEFWLCLAAGVAATLQGLLIEGSPAAQVVTAIVAALAAIGYTAGRARVKAALATSNPDAKA